MPLNPEAPSINDWGKGVRGWFVELEHIRKGLS